MTKPMIRIHNTETNEVIDREMTDAEFVEYQKIQADEAEKQLQIQAKAQAKAALPATNRLFPEIPPLTSNLVVGDVVLIPTFPSRLTRSLVFCVSPYSVPAAIS